MGEKKLNGLKAQLAPLSEEETVSPLSPFQREISVLLVQYQSGQFEDAEKLAISIPATPTPPV